MTENRKQKKKSKTGWILAAIAGALVLGVGALWIGGVFSGTKNPVPLPGGIDFPSDEQPVRIEDGDLPEALRTLRITTTANDGKSLPQDGAFRLKTDTPCDAETIARYLTVSPSTELSYVRVSDNEFQITPASGSFLPGTVYRFTLGDPTNPAASYAFQTETELCVKTVLPADRALSVPVDSGIEVLFTETLAKGDLSSYVKISPAVRGTVQLYPDGKGLVFLPSQQLAFDTVYEVTVKKGLPGASGKKLEEDLTFRFHTEVKGSASSNDFVSLSLPGSFYNLTKIVSQGEEVGLNFYCSASGRNITLGSVMTSVYRFPSGKAALDAIKNYETHLGDAEWHYDTKSLTFVKGVTEAVNEESMWKGVSVSLGTYEPGVYLIRAELKANTARGADLTCVTEGFFQVSDLRPFTASSDGKTLLWVNTAGKAAQGASELSVEGVSYTRYDGWSVTDPASSMRKISGKTDKDGIFTFDNNSDNAALLLIRTQNGGQEVLAALSDSQTETDPYLLKTVYSDRSVYFANDTVNFWGMLVPAYENTAIPEVLYLKTGLSASPTPIRVAKDGTFSGSLTLEDMTAGGFYLRFCDENDKEIVTRFCRITEESKPVIRASLTFDKLFYRYGETANVTLRATFFDGTPAPGFEFYFSGYPFAVTAQNSVTDENGEIHAVIRTGMVTAYSTDPSTVSVNAELIGMETQTLTVWQSVPYFHSDMVYGAHYEDGKTLITLNERDTSRLLTEADMQWGVFPANTVGRPLDGTLSYTLKKYVESFTDETQYDAYTKKVTHYRRRHVDKVFVKSGSFAVKDGVCELPLLKTEGSIVGYCYEVTYHDGRQSFTLTLDGTEARAYRGYSYGQQTQIVLDKESYRPGDTVNASFRFNGEPVSGVLYLLFANGMEDNEVTDLYAHTFTDSMRPGANLASIWYDSEADRYYTVLADLLYDYEADAVLTPVVTADKEQYRPGEQAILRVSVPGAKGGMALLSIVDEACLALGDNPLDPAEFYRSVGKASKYGAYYYYYSRGNGIKPYVLDSRLNVAGTVMQTQDDLVLYAMKDGAGGDRFAADAVETEEAVPEAAPGETNGSETGGKGEDGEKDVYIRQYFADNPEFRVLPLDENGEGVLTFTVPDNITSWRVTAAAASGLPGENGSLVRFGSSVSDLIVTQSFFLSPNVCERYLTGDDLAFSMRAYGTDAVGAISYTVSLYDENDVCLDTVTVTSPDCLSHGWIRFKGREAGTYRAVVTGTCGDQSDAVIVTLKVVDSAAAIDVRRTVTPEEIGTLSPMTYPVTLTFYRGGASSVFYQQILNRLLWSGKDIVRADSIAARYTARQASEAFFGTTPSDDLTSLLNQLRSCGSTFVSLLPYSDEDLLLTARLFALSTDLLPANRIGQILSSADSIVSESRVRDPETLCASLLILSAMNEPVLDRLYGVASQAADYSPEARLYLAAAFAAIGDYGAAQTVYRTVRDEIGVIDGEYGTLYLKGETQSETITLTELSLFTTARCLREDAMMAGRYLLGNQSEDQRAELGLAMLLRYFLPVGETGEKTFSYRILDGEEKTVTLSGSERYVLTLNRKELASLVLSDTDGIGIRAAYGGSIGEAMKDSTESGRVKVTKQYEQIANGRVLVTLTVSGTTSRIGECFSLTDFIPSGARFFEAASNAYTYERQGGVYVSASLWNRSGQTMDGWVSVYNQNEAVKGKYLKTVCDPYSFSVSVSYVIRGAVEGTSLAESAILRSEAVPFYAVSDRTLVTVSENGKWSFQTVK